MADKNEQIWTLMGEIETAMIVTHANGEDMRARPMVARPERDHNAIYFLTDASAPKDQEIEQNAKVCLTFSDTKSSRYVSLTGSADVIADPALVESVWKTADKAFWKSPQDPQIRVIRVTPDRGEYWEGAGMIATFVNVVAAGAKGERPKLGENAKVAM